MSFRRSPFEDVERMFDQMRRSMWSADADAQWARPDSNVSVETDDEGYVVVADLPGFEKPEIDLRFAEDTLTIEATHDVAGGPSTRSRHVYEEVAIPAEVVDEEITASYHNGVLEVRLPTAGDADDGATRIDVE